MASLISRAGELLRRMVTSVAWLLADWTGWRVATALYPSTLRGKTAIVTGANSGIGLETTKALLQQGATVIMACRVLENGKAAREEILRDPSNHGSVGNAAARLKVMKLDYEDFTSIRRFADEFHQLGLPLNVLVNNAGVHLKPYKHVDCGFERNMADNYFGHFYLTHLLLDDLKNGAPSRVVNMGSVGEVMGIRYMMVHGIDWDDIPGRNLRDSGDRAYGISKTFKLMALTRELARRLEGTGVDVIAVHPGVTDSSWYKKADNEAYTFSWIISRVRAVAPFIGVGQPTRSGAISSIYAAIAPELTGITSSTKSHGIIDWHNRSLFGGRLIYYGPAYIFNLLMGPVNFLNAWRCYVLNPYCYNKAACKKLYETTLDLISEVERELGLTSSQPHAVSNSATTDSTSTDITNGRVDGADGASSGVVYEDAVHNGLKQRQQAEAASAAPLGAY